MNCNANPNFSVPNKPSVQVYDLVKVRNFFAQTDKIYKHFSSLTFLKDISLSRNRKKYRTFLGQQQHHHSTGHNCKIQIPSDRNKNESCKVLQLHYFECRINFFCPLLKCNLGISASGALFGNKRFMLDEMTQQNPSNFAIFLS